MDARLGGAALTARTGVRLLAAQRWPGAAPGSWSGPGRNPGVLLYAPLRLCLYEDLDGQPHLSVDPPSDQFGSFGHPDMAATGKMLDEKLADLLTGLGVAVPGSLT
jgi:hypothetical protein